MADLVKLEQNIFMDIKSLKGYLAEYEKSIIKIPEEKEKCREKLESAIQKLEEECYPPSAVRKRAESKVSMLEFDKLDMYCKVLKEKIGSIRDSISANQSLLAMEKTKIEKGFYSEGG
jgi:hypothetical protein